jgi:PAS domain S-box-containing protein
MKTISTQRTLWLSVTALLTVGIVLVSIYSLKNGFYDIFPYFYILPILMIAYYYPRYSVYITVLLGWIFLALVYLYGPADIRLYTSSFAFFYIFVSIGIIITAFAGQSLQERKYREIFENSQAGIFTFDLHLQQIQETNSQAAAILGYTREELSAQLFSTLWFDDAQDTKFIRKILADGHITDLEIALRKKDRTVIWVLITAAMTKEDWVVCSIVDISESKSMKDELIESELRYRTLFDGASDAIFLHDLDGKIYETNVIATRLLGYSKKEFMQMRLHDVDINPEAFFSREMMQDISSRGYLLFETVQKKKDGTQVPVEISSRMTEYFGMSAIMSTVRDISGRKKE